MLTLNLLSPEEKAKFKTIRINRLVLVWAMRIFTLLLVFIILLLNIYFYLVIQLRTVERLTLQEEKNVASLIAQNFEQEIKAINKKLQLLDEMTANSHAFSFILEDLAKMAPGGIQFYSFYFDAQTKKAVLDGYALTREEFLAFREALTAYPKFSEIESPISNLIKSTDNNFRVSFLIK